MTELLTPHLRLRLLGPDDLALYERLYACPQVMAQIGAPLTAEAAERAFRAAVAHNGRDDPGHRTFVAFDRATQAALGIGALARSGRRAEIGLMLLPAAWGGIASREVMDALVNHAFGAMRLEALDAACRAGPNERPGQRLVAPYGFVRLPSDDPGIVRWVLDRRPPAQAPAIGSADAAG